MRGTCFHRSPFMIWHTVLLLSLYSLCMSAWEKIPAATARRINNTSLSVNFSHPERARPFLEQSCMLSDWVPENKWLGFTHAGVSHRCKTCTPAGRSKPEWMKEIRCAKANPQGQNPNFPYPLLAIVPCQIQHPFSSFLWSDQNLRSDRSDILRIRSSGDRARHSAACIDSVCELLGHSGRTKRLECSLFVNPSAMIRNT